MPWRWFQHFYCYLNNNPDYALQNLSGQKLLLKANDYDQLVELVKDCPIFEYEGNIEIREMIPIEME